MKWIVSFAILLSAACTAALDEPCSEPSSVSDAKLIVSFKNGRADFQEGEIIPLVLSFTSNAKNRYWADDRNYDRSGRLPTETYCLVPLARDPLEQYFATGGFIGGGLGSTRQLSITPFTVESELNEWRQPKPGHYRLWVVSHRVWRPPDPREQTPYGRLDETLRSNTIEFDVRRADRRWQTQQLWEATGALTGAPSPQDATHAARVLRFLNTKESTRQLAKLYWALNQQPHGWDMMFGLFGSSYRALAIDAMRAEFAVPDHPITQDFLDTLVQMQIEADPAWEAPTYGAAQPDAAKSYWENRQAQMRELLKEQVAAVIVELPRKNAHARALTVQGLLMSAGTDDPNLARNLRKSFVASWTDLPRETQLELVQYRWPLVAGPEMLPILRDLARTPPPTPRTNEAMARDAALKHIYEMDPAEGRRLLVRDLEDVRAQPSLDLVKLLAPEEIAPIVHAAAERISKNEARNLDYLLLDRYADAAAMPMVQPIFEAHLGKWACEPQDAMLRYFFRVESAYGAQQVRASLAARHDTHCYSMLLQDLGKYVASVSVSAMDALNDPDAELANDAALALGRWGPAESEHALWSRLERFHLEWTGRDDELRRTQDYNTPVARWAGFEETLVHAIASGTNWLCEPEKLDRLYGLAFPRQQQQISSWKQQWEQGAPTISPNWFPEDSPTFSVLQYGPLEEEQLRAKLAQFPWGTKLLWQFWKPGQISPPVSMKKQESIYERMRAAAEGHGVVIEKQFSP